MLHGLVKFCSPNDVQLSTFRSSDHDLTSCAL